MRGWHFGTLTAGVVYVVIGVIVLLDRLDVLEFDLDVWRYLGPGLLMIVGLGLFLSGRSPHEGGPATG